MLIRNASVALPGQDDFQKVDILVVDGKFAQVGVHLSGEGREILDRKGMLVFPGAVDPHVHFDEPGFTHREDFAHGSAEAARGGVTTVIDMPCTSLPPVTDSKALAGKLEIVRTKAHIDFAFYGGLHGGMTPERIRANVRELAPYVAGFKCYFVSGMDSFPAVGDEQFKAAIQACAEAGRPLLLHAESQAVIAAAGAALAARRGSGAPRWQDYYLSRPMGAEIAACEKALDLAGTDANWLHIVHVGTAEAASMAASAGATCETCAHYLAFDETDFETLGAALKTAPPVKEVSQKALLWKLLSGGAISFVASDHAGAPASEKFTGNPLTVYGGIPGTGTLFPYLLSEGLFAKRLGLQKFLEVTSTAAARRYGLFDRKGSIAVGKDADFVIVDPERASLLDPEAMLSKSSITPFAGMRFSGKIEETYLRGRAIFGKTISGESRIETTPGSGEFIKRGL
jgi:allantoinase